MNFIFKQIALLFLLLNYSEAQSLFEKFNTGKIYAGEIVAEVDSIKITAEEFFYSYEYGPAFPKQQSASKEVHLKYMINEKLLALAGFKSGLYNNREITEVHKDIEADIAAEELFKDKIIAFISIDEKEIEDIVKSKNVELEISWLAADEEDILKYIQILKDNSKYDSLFSAQLNDSVFSDQRKMNVTEFQLRKKNPQLCEVIDTMEAGQISSPIFANKEWYLIRLENKTKNLMINGSEFINKSKEARAYLTKGKADSLSDLYVNNLMADNEPVIKRDAFNILRSYLGKFILPREKFDDWNLENRLEYALNNLGKNFDDEYSEIFLVEAVENRLSVAEFIFWFRNREQYIKMDYESLDEYSRSLEQLVWRMTRDKLLAKEAREVGYFDKQKVRKQSLWWKEKISSSAFQNHLSNSIILEKAEIVSSKKHNNFDEELRGKIFRELEDLKSEYRIIIYKNALDNINVSSKNHPREIELHTVKKGGLIPRTPYPTIDYLWKDFQ